MPSIRSALTLARTFAHALVRRQTVVKFGDLSTVSPVSSKFGHERGRPIDRYYIERFLKANASVISGRVMEIGECRYTKAFGSKVTQAEVLHAVPSATATVVGDLTRPASLPFETIDCLICTQTLGFIFDVAGAVAGIHHVLRPGGVALVTVAGISQISRYDHERWGDYWRFTDQALARLFEPTFGANVTIETHGNVAAAMSLLQGIAIEDLPDASVLDHRDPDYQVTITVVATKRALPHNLGPAA